MHTCLSTSLSILPRRGHTSSSTSFSLTGTDFGEAHRRTVKRNIFSVQIVGTVLLIVVIVAVRIVVILVLVVRILGVVGRSDAADGRRCQALQVQTLCL